MRSELVGGKCSHEFRNAGKQERWNGELYF